jgi:Alr-MurF fusion protein
MAVSYSAQELALMMQAKITGCHPQELRITVLLTDSRKVTFATSAVFFALKTRKNDGHRFIGELIEKGVRCFVVSSLPRNNQWLQQATFLTVADTLEALQMLVAGHRNHFSCPVLGITGSNGKTIVKEWLTQLLTPELNILKNPRSYNSQTGVPLSVWNLDYSHELAVFEAGISKMGEMQKLTRVIKPDLGIFTNIGPAHDEGFPDTQTKIFEKLTLFHNSSLLIYNSEQSLVGQCIRQWVKLHPRVNLFHWGTNEDDHLRIVNQQHTGNHTRMELVYEQQHHHFVVPFTDKASLENLMHCLAFIFSRNLYNPELPLRVMKLAPLAMRMEMKQAINHCLLINDAYSSDILSLGIALDFLVAQSGHRPKVVIMSDIHQSGMKPVELYTGVAALLKEKEVNILLGVGKELSRHAHLFKELDATFFDNTDALLQNEPFRRFHQMGILLKGARDFSFERISSKLQLKDHQTVLEINLNALVYNLDLFRSLLSPSTKIMAMVKAFSYGSGSFEIAAQMQFHGVDYLAVAFADEGTHLRNSGITMPIVVLNPELHNLDILFRYNLQPEVYSLGLLKRLSDALQQFPQYNSENPFPLHIKLDTGMHRLGLMENDLEELLGLLNPSIKVASVFSHLAASDLEQYDDFTHSQLRLFDNMCQYIRQHLGYDFPRHIGNSAAISRFPEAHYEMVRLGIGLYGIDTSGLLADKLQNVTTFKSVISQIKELPAGESVGYNRAAMLTRATRMAVVPVGYADGLNRRLGNGRYNMIINGQNALTLGNISMDMCCLDITGIDAREGDEVIIFGEQHPVQEMAGILDTIPYEVFTAIPQRVKRVYFSE